MKRYCCKLKMKACAAEEFPMLQTGSQGFDLQLLKIGIHIRNWERQRYVNEGHQKKKEGSDVHSARGTPKMVRNNNSTSHPGREPKKGRGRGEEILLLFQPHTRPRSVTLFATSIILHFWRCSWCVSCMLCPSWPTAVVYNSERVRMYATD